MKYTCKYQKKMNLEVPKSKAGRRQRSGFGGLTRLTGSSLLHKQLKSERDGAAGCDELVPSLRWEIDQVAFYYFREEWLQFKYDRFDSRLFYGGGRPFIHQPKTSMTRTSPPQHKRRGFEYRTRGALARR
jgi:hypothetical protein